MRCAGHDARRDLRYAYDATRDLRYALRDLRYALRDLRYACMTRHALRDPRHAHSARGESRPSLCACVGCLRQPKRGHR